MNARQGLGTEPGSLQGKLELLALSRLFSPSQILSPEWVSGEGCLHGAGSVSGGVLSVRSLVCSEWVWGECCLHSAGSVSGGVLSVRSLVCC